MQLQTKHSKYTVSVRIRPNLQLGQNSVFITSDKSHIKEIKSHSIVTYQFDNVYDESDNNYAIYNHSIKHKVDDFLNKSLFTTILAYGQTGSGKTHTLFGYQKKQKGIVDYIIEDILNEVNKQKEQIQFNFLQIYNEKVTDLLTNKIILLRDNNNNQLILDGQSKITIRNINQLLLLLKQIHSNKFFGSSYIHSQSSRSHIIFIIKFRKCLFNIIDLCGTQVLTYQFDQKQRNQTNNINLSLFTLNTIIHDLCNKNNNINKFIPFRNSVLTRLLKSSLINTSKTQIYLFCNISPEKQHQQMSSNTLRFGQIAIQIDQYKYIDQNKINLSKQNRQKKIIPKVIQITPKINKQYPKILKKWSYFKQKICGNLCIIYKLQSQIKTICNILFLHAYGYNCCGNDWDLYLTLLNQFNLCANFYSIDFPGFGKSQGKKFTSRSQKFQQKGQPQQFMIELFKILAFMDKKVFLIGYDLGGAIALSCCMNAKLVKCINGIIVFHPTWTDSIGKLAIISVPVLLLWFTVETFHLISMGQKMVKNIKKSQLYKFNIGPYTNEKASGYYDLYSKELSCKILEFILKNNQNNNNLYQNNLIQHRGKIIEQQIIIDKNQQQIKINNIHQSIQYCYKLIQKKQINKIYSIIIKGGNDKSKYLKIINQLPILQPETLTWQLLYQYKIISKYPNDYLDYYKLPLFIAGQQLHVRTQINLSVLKGKSSYLAYQQSGQLGLTHRAYVSVNQSEEKIRQSNKLLVNVALKNEDFKQVSVPLLDVVMLNAATISRKNSLGAYIFQDGLTCKYSSSITKLKLLQCCYMIAPLLQKIDFHNETNLLQIQQQCTRLIYTSMDLKHLVHEGIDNSRYGGLDIGRLAYYGQGNCHHLASVLCALLLPFGRLLGWQVIFRAGSFFSTNRQIDSQGKPLVGWDGKPKVNVQDHTWLQIIYKPSYIIKVFDPSFNICNIALDQIYTFEGKMHISGKIANFALKPTIPTLLYKNKIFQTNKIYF